MYDRILVPTDGSDGARAAIDHAIALANDYDAALHTVYVVETAAISPEMGAGTVVDALEETAERAIEDVRERAEKGGVETVEASIVHGVAHSGILEYAENHDVDLIVMGTHGRTGISRYLLGSVTEKVVRLADVPVLTVRMAEGEDGETSG